MYCDESDSSGQHIANFYGGALVESVHLAQVSARLAARKQALNLLGEVKWQKMTEPYAQKYMDLAMEMFDLVHEGKIKLRIMRTP